MSTHASRPPPPARHSAAPPAGVITGETISSTAAGGGRERMIVAQRIRLQCKRSTKPRKSATRAGWLRAPVFSKTCLRCSRTVPRPRPSRLAIMSRLIPSARRTAISLSRRVSPNVSAMVARSIVSDASGSVMKTATRAEPGPGTASVQSPNREHRQQQRQPARGPIESNAPGPMAVSRLTAAIASRNCWVAAGVRPPVRRCLRSIRRLRRQSTWPDR